ncbi:MULTISPECIES: ATP synthase A1 subunit C [unclassified Methanoregula]|uniref:ATP synthase A1 subunit C n=1 Tax=unclassified Methanoregula TaxID=2649730 RepID=UPI0009D44968|nr:MULTISPECIES: ATP synthase A1 subunit C [unclassified Methanoregula]OPX63252.1 MAG: V-type ATP synthase subunit C [Methanoregula sp. PtaB.Bin085]OPY35002.1 MAG: V-type ATP synthase subunit C [Methanoregula sp. PtaU1.Bin006]
MDYGYINARMRGMKSRLLSRRSLDDLIMKPDLESLIADLENSPYREDIIEAKGRSTGIACIENALRQNFIRTFRKIQNFSKQEPEAGEYIAIFLHRWDVQNIKTILRGKNIHTTNEEILECLVPAGELDEVTLKELLKQPDVRSVIDLLATWKIRYAKPLTESFAEFWKSRDLAILECALDRYYYTDALAAVKAPTYNNNLIRDLLALEIDVVNLRTVLRMVRDSVDPADAERYIIPGGKEFDLRKLRHLLTLPAIDDVVRALVATRYRFLSRIPEAAIRTQKISVIEKELERYLIREGVGAFLLDPLSVASVIGYFWAKYNEITNIRIISRCKTADFPVENLKEELVYV